VFSGLALLDRLGKAGTGWGRLGQAPGTSWPAKRCFILKWPKEDGYWLQSLHL